MKIQLGKRFYDFLNSQHSMNKRTKKRYIGSMREFCFLSEKPFEDCYLDEPLIHEVLAILDKVLEPSSWNGTVAKCQRLAKWLSDPNDKIMPIVWQKIEHKKIDWEDKLKDKWLTETEFLKLVDATQYPRDRALLAVAIAGLRPGELLCPLLKDVTPYGNGYKIMITGKTKSRPIFITDRFAPLLRQWLNFHPLRGDPNAPLWIQRRTGYGPKSQAGQYERLGYNGWYNTLNTLAHRAGIKKKVSPHWLRHTRVTWTASNRKVQVSNAVANKTFGWSQNSTMYSRYSHITGKDVEDTVFALDGVKRVEDQEEKPSVLQPRVCFGCGELNAPTATYCAKCGLVLDENEAQKVLLEKRFDEFLKRKFMAEFEGK